MITKQPILFHDVDDKSFYEALLGCWEHTLTSAYSQALAQAGDDEVAQQRLIQALDACFSDDSVPPTRERLGRILDQSAGDSLQAVS